MTIFQKPLYEQLRNLVEKRQNELIELTSKLIFFPNVSPPGRNSTEAQEFIKKYLEELGFTVDSWEEYPGDPNLIAVLKGSERNSHRSLILNGHVDVVGVNDSEWSFDPFKAFVKNNRLYGRGTSDMKAGLAGALFAARILKDCGVKLKGDLIIHSVTGEEAGEGTTFTCTKQGPKADFAICMDLSDLQIQGQGGVITGWITIQSPTTHHDGTRASMIHAGGGAFGASAIEKMVKVINGLQELEWHWAVTKKYEGFPPGSNTINPAVIEGGRHAAFVADRCALWITVHFYPDEDYEEVCQEIEEHILNVSKADPWLKQNPPIFRWGGKSMLEERGEIFPSLEIEPDSQAVELLASAHKAATGEPPKIGMSSLVTDGGWLARAGVPTVIYGPGELSMAHGVDESVCVKQLQDYVKVLVSFIAWWNNLEREQ